MQVGNHAFIVAHSPADSSSELSSIATWLHVINCIAVHSTSMVCINTAPIADPINSMVEEADPIVERDEDYNKEVNLEIAVI